MVLEHWLAFESSPLGDSQILADLQSKIPKKVKKRRRVRVINSETGEEVTQADQDSGWEEFYDYLFPEDEEALCGVKKGLKILEMAQKWKKEQGK